MVRNVLRDTGMQSVLGGAALGVAVLALGVGLLLAFDKGAERLVGWIFVATGATIGGIFLIGLVLIVVDHIFLRLRTFYRDRGEMNAATGGLLREVQSSRLIWHATYAGHYATFNDLLGKPQFRRLLLLHPYGNYINVLTATLQNETTAGLATKIEQATKAAQAHSVEVRWFDGPFVGMVVMNPDDDDSRIRAEIIIPFTDTRPGFTVLRKDRLYTVLRKVYDDLWNGGAKPELP